MDDWGSPWADDARESRPSSPQAAAPVESEQSPPNPNLKSQSIGNILTGLERSSPWVDDEGFGEWAGVESSAAPVVRAFPDWSAETSTKIHLSPDREEKGDFDIRSELEPFWRSEAGIHLGTVEVYPDSRSGLSHGTLVTEPVPPNDRASVEATTKPHGDRRIDIPQGPLQPTVLLADWKDERSTNLVRHHTKLPSKSSIEEGSSSSRPSSSPESEKNVEIGTAESPRTPLEEVAVLSEERKLWSSSSQKPSPALTDPVSFKSHDAAGDDEDDFGDFEETKCAEVGEPGVDPRSPITLKHPGEGQTTSTTPIPRIRLEVQAFEVDMSLLDRVIPQSHSVDSPPAMEDDIISSTSSRKAWYRVSRKETMREHNGGGEDYVRATWAGSSIQANVVKVVARWITEDRIAGGVILGAGNRLGAMFGWGEDARSAQRVPEKQQTGSKKDLPPSSGKASSPGITSRPLSLVASQSAMPSTVNSPIESPINSNVGEVNTPIPQFGWSSSSEEVNQPTLDTPRSAANTHHRAVSMISMPGSMSPLGTISCPPPQLRPASLDLSIRKTSESFRPRGPKNVGPRSSAPSPWAICSARGATQLASPTSQGNFSVRDSGQHAAKVKLDALEGQYNARASTDPLIFNSRSSAETSQFKSLRPGEFSTLDVRKLSGEVTEDEIVEVSKAIKGLPNLAYMLR